MKILLSRMITNLKSKIKNINLEHGRGHVQIYISQGFPTLGICYKTASVHTQKFLIFSTYLHILWNVLHHIPTIHGLGPVS